MTKSCAFTACNASYLGQAIVSLVSVKKHNPGLDLILIGSRFSISARKVAAKYGITCLSVDDKLAFRQTSQYPEHCFYWFLAAEVLAPMGYSRAMYVDADILCTSGCSSALKTVKGLSGVDGGSIRTVLSACLPTVEKLWGKISPDARRVQSGVLFLNLTFLRSFLFSAKASDLFEQCFSAGAPIKGDDSLLAAMQHAYPGLPIEWLPFSYNKMEDVDYRKYTRHSWLTANEDEFFTTKVYHFTKRSPKPWLIRASHPTYLSKFFAEKWRHLAVDLLENKDLKRWFPQIHQLKRRRPLRLYWYGQHNVGDLVTPYLLKQAVPQNRLSIRRISEKTIRRVERRKKLERFVSLGMRRSNAAQYSVSTGSVHRLCGDHALVFGSGARSSGQSTARPRVRFVRGPLTRQLYIDRGVECPPIYGDPGLLLPDFYDPSVEVKHKLGIVPHFTEYETVTEQFKSDNRVLVINMGSGDIELVVRQLKSCEKTISSSLHGLVFSHAYRIPTRHVKFGDSIYGDGSKFVDYYCGIGLPFRPPVECGSPFFPFEQLACLPDEVSAFDCSYLRDNIFISRSGRLKPSGLFYPW